MVHLTQILTTSSSGYVFHELRTWLTMQPQDDDCLDLTNQRSNRTRDGQRISTLLDCIAEHEHGKIENQEDH